MPPASRVPTTTAAETVSVPQPAAARPLWTYAIAAALGVALGYVVGTKVGERRGAGPVTRRLDAVTSERDELYTHLGRCESQRRRTR